jgi:hypothetical protein
MVAAVGQYGTSSFSFTMLASFSRYPCHRSNWSRIMGVADGDS